VFSICCNTFGMNTSDEEPATVVNLPPPGFRIVSVSQNVDIAPSSTESDASDNQQHDPQDAAESDQDAHAAVGEPESDDASGQEPLMIDEAVAQSGSGGGESDDTSDDAPVAGHGVAPSGSGGGASDDTTDDPAVAGHGVAPIGSGGGECDDTSGNPSVSGDGEPDGANGANQEGDSDIVLSSGPDEIVVSSGEEVPKQQRKSKLCAMAKFADTGSGDSGSESSTDADFEYTCFVIDCGAKCLHRDVNDWKCCFRCFRSAPDGWACGKHRLLIEAMMLLFKECVLCEKSGAILCPHFACPRHLYDQLQQSTVPMWKSLTYEYIVDKYVDGCFTPAEGPILAAIEAAADAGSTPSSSPSRQIVEEPPEDEEQDPSVEEADEGRDGSTSSSASSMVRPEHAEAKADDADDDEEEDMPVKKARRS
jgi:hypothetical protein